MLCSKDVVFIRTFCTPYISKYLSTKDGKVIWVLITLTFKLCALLDNNHFVIKKIISKSFVQKMSKYLNTKDGKVIWVLMTLTFKLCALLDNNHFVTKKIILQYFVQKTPCSFSTTYMSKSLNTKLGKVIRVLIPWTFELYALLDRITFLTKKIMSQCFVQQLPCSLGLSVPVFEWTDRRTEFPLSDSTTSVEGGE